MVNTIIGLIIGLIAGGCLGLVISCLLFVSGHGDEHERELRHKMVKDVKSCCDEYEDKYPQSISVVNQICDDVCYIIRQEQV